MWMPILLPEKLNYCERAATSSELFDILVKYPPDLILFLEIACSDETWSEANFDFLHQAIAWVNQQFFQDTLLMEFAQRLGHVFRKHPSVARPHLPLNAVLKLKDKDLPINTLLYGSSSEFLKETIRLECRDRKSESINLREIPFHIFEVVQDFIEKGNVEGIYVKDKDAAEKVLELAIAWELPELAKESQWFLTKWITRDNFLETLLKAHRKGWDYLRKGCFEFINFLGLDAQLIDSAPERLAFEFLRFSENSLALFHRLTPFITDLVCGGTTTQDEPFKKVVNECPRLLCVDISYSYAFSTYLKDLPVNLSELRLSSCSWLKRETFDSLLQICPHLTKLSIASNVGLGFESWGELRKMEQLNSLDISRCSQISDDDLRLILQACTPLTALTMEECRGISDRGFYEMPLFNSNFTALNLARTNISDHPVVELASKCPNLMYLCLTRCEKITEKGVLEAVRAARMLRELNISNCNIPHSTIDKLKNLKPFLSITI
jgi:F-box and leucine-rich repeat protein 2/20